MDWSNALNQRASDRKFQPNTGSGSQRAGLPGMGGGSVPYAPGSTQWRADTAPPTHTPQPQGSGVPGHEGPQAASGGPQGYQPSGGGGASQGAFNPAMVLAYANYLMNHFRNTTYGNQGYRG